VGFGCRASGFGKGSAGEGSRFAEAQKPEPAPQMD
jgi:hypothetical protein